MTNGDTTNQPDELAIRRPIDPAVEARCFNEIMRLRIEMMERENNLKEALRAEFRAAIQQNKTELQAQIQQSTNELLAQIQQNNTDLRAAIEQNRNNLQTRIDDNNTALEDRLHQNNTDLRAAVQQGSSNYTAVASLVVTVIAFMAAGVIDV
uniref:Uncharacterized protein n=1 Tax=Meloidogyne javanica TaxID=6303 RepID=A0A915MJB3_MELJA